VSARSGPSTTWRVPADLSRKMQIRLSAHASWWTETPAEFKAKLVELVRAGRTPEALSREFKPSARAIADRVRQFEADSGKRPDALSGVRPWQEEWPPRVVAVSARDTQALANDRMCPMRGSPRPASTCA